MTGDLLNVTLREYNIRLSDYGVMSWSRYGEPQNRDLSGDNLVLSLATEVQDLRSDLRLALKTLKECREILEDDEDVAGTYFNTSLTNLIEELDEKDS